MQKNNKLFNIIGNNIRHPIPTLNIRKNDVLLNRLRIGHTALTHSFLLKGEEKPNCERCGQPLSVQHILLDCTQTQHIRQKYYRAVRLPDLFNENVVSKQENILLFLRELGLLDKL